MICAGTKLRLSVLSFERKKRREKERKLKSEKTKPKKKTTHEKRATAIKAASNLRRVRQCEVGFRGRSKEGPKGSVAGATMMSFSLCVCPLVPLAFRARVNIMMEASLLAQSLADSLPEFTFPAWRWACFCFDVALSSPPCCGCYCCTPSPPRAGTK